MFKKRINTKKILAILGVTILLAGNVGCALDPEEYYYKNEIDKAIEYLEEKYGDHFIGVGYENADLLSTTDTVYCYEENMNPDEEKVLVYINRANGEVKYSDNYFGYVVRPEVETWISDIVKTEFDDVKVYQSKDLGVYPDDLTKENNLGDLFELEPHYFIHTTIYVNGDKNMTKEEYEEKTKALEKLFMETGKFMGINIYVVNNEVYEQMNRYSWDEFWFMFEKLPKVDGEICYHLYEKSFYEGEIQPY